MSNIENFLHSLKVGGIILSGGDNIGDNPERDKTENKLIEYGINHKIPIFGVCRGMQVLNTYFGGSVLKNQGKNHTNKPHSINIINNSFSSLLRNNSLHVNSFHKNLIKNENLGDRLQAFAIVNDDETIEGIFHKDFPILGVMWHPEREINSTNELIVKSLFERKMFWEK